MTRSQPHSNAPPEGDHLAQLREEKLWKTVMCELIEYGNAMARGDNTNYTQRQWDTAVAKAWELIR